LSVPVDWSRPRGDRTFVEVARMPAQDPVRRLGALVVHTGADSVVQDVRARPDTVGELTRWFDVVLVEARGAGDRGSAAAVRCGRGRPGAERLQLASGRRAWHAYARDNAAYDRSCRAAAGSLYGGLTSWQMAHDLDAVRAALGEPRLRYLGNGYGSVYGQAYQKLFPGRVGRMYLEGLPDQAETGLERRLIALARARERQLGYFRDWCATRLGCPLGGADAIEVFDDLVRRAGAGRRRQVVAAVWAGLVQARWQELAGAMSRARAGDWSGLAAMAAVPQPVAPGSVNRVAQCHDFKPVVPGYRRFLEMEGRLRGAAPRVGWLSGRYEIAQCLGIGHGAAESRRPVEPDNETGVGRGAASGGAVPNVGRGAASGGAVPNVGRGAASGGAVPNVGRGAAGGGGLLPGPGGGVAGGGLFPGAGWGAIGGGVIPGVGWGAVGGGVLPGVGRGVVLGGVGSVVVGVGRLDSDTPAAGAVRAAGRIPGAVVLWHGDGGGAYLAQGVHRLRAACLRARVHDYLVNGVAPKPGAYCPAELTP
jgi:pimeloyl-ACP methyl ester carboxylesterase